VDGVSKVMQIDSHGKIAKSWGLAPEDLGLTAGKKPSPPIPIPAAGDLSPTSWRLTPKETSTSPTFPTKCFTNSIGFNPNSRLLLHFAI